MFFRAAAGPRYQTGFRTLGVTVRPEHVFSLVEVLSFDRVFFVFVSALVLSVLATCRLRPGLLRHRFGFGLVSAFRDWGVFAHVYIQICYTKMSVFCHHARPWASSSFAYHARTHQKTIQVVVHIDIPRRRPRRRLRAPKRAHRIPKRGRRSFQRDDQQMDPKCGSDSCHRGLLSTL